MRIYCIASLLMIAGYSQEFEGTGKIERFLSKTSEPQTPVAVRLDGKDESITAWFQTESIAPLTKGTRIWLSGTEKKSEIEVKDFEILPDKGAKSIDKSVENNLVKITVKEVYPWCDHMPGYGKEEKRQYLKIRLEIVNKTNKELEITLARTFLSFDADLEGALAKGVSLMNDGGNATGETKITLKAKELLEIGLRGDGQFAEGNHGNNLYATMLFKTGDSRFFARSSGTVLETQ